MALIATYNAQFFFALLIILSTVSALAFLVQADNIGFSAELIHKESPNSFLFSASKTTTSSFTIPLRHCVNHFNRYNRTLATSEAAQSTVIYGDYNYLMKISIGTPPFEILAIAATASDLTWTQCKSCTMCYNQKASLFDPKSSSTYKIVNCSSSQCQSFHRQTFCESHVCSYEYSYADETYTDGVLATDTVTLGSTSGQELSLPNTIISCGTYNVGDFDGKSGVIGLGRGAVSLISRMNQLIDGKFSYCLVPYFSKHSSKMNFGSKSVVSGPGVVSTPLFSGDPDTYYFLRLEAVSAGDKRLEYGKIYSYSGKGNIVIDSGTTLTYLPEIFFYRLELALREKIHLNPVDDPTQQFSLCYKAEANFSAPIITMHFKGADVKLNNFNTFVKTTKNVVCLAFYYTHSIPVLGNRQQMNFLIGYDLKRNIVSFKQTDCNKY